MRLLALDQASKTSGWAVFIDDKLETYGHFTINDSDVGEKLVKIRNNIIELIEKYNIDYVAFEDIQLQNNIGNNVVTFKILAEVFGVVSELLTERKISHEAVLAGTWKSTLDIKGRTRPDQKRNAQAYAVNTYNIKVTQDEADAVCIGSHIVKKRQNVQPVADFDWS